MYLAAYAQLRFCSPVLRFGLCGLMRVLRGSRNRFTPAYAEICLIVLFLIKSSNVIRAHMRIGEPTIDMRKTQIIGNISAAHMLCREFVSVSNVTPCLLPTALERARTLTNTFL